MYVCGCVCVHVHMDVCVCVCVCVCACMCLHMYISAHTHVHTYLCLPLNSGNVIKHLYILHLCVSSSRDTNTVQVLQPSVMQAAHSRRVVRLPMENRLYHYLTHLVVVCQIISVLLKVLLKIHGHV